MVSFSLGLIDRKKKDKENKNHSLYLFTGGSGCKDVKRKSFPGKK